MGQLTQFAPFLLMFVVIYFFMIRPQQKRAKNEKEFESALKVGDKINIKLGGDRRNVGRKQKHVMLTMCILNEGEAVLNPTH